MMRNGTKKWIPVALLAVGIGLTCVGLALGQNAEVLKKAIKICTECIGLG